MTTRNDICKLTDGELRQKLREHGTQPGPITGTTRKVYEKQLLNLSDVRSPGSEVKSKLKTHDCTPSNQPITSSGDIRCTRMDTKNDKDPKALIKFNLNIVKTISNRELRQKFLSMGRVCGPLTETTRSVHEDLMAKLLLEGHNYDALSDQSFEESRHGWLLGSVAPEKLIESKSFHSFEELRLNFFRDKIRETIIDIDSVDLRDIGNTEYDGVRTALALYDGHCQQRSKDDRHSKPKRVKLIGIVQNLFLEAKYSSSQDQLIQKHVEYKEIFAYHATSLENVPSIIRKNLDPNHPVAHGRRFGDGCYFSEYPEFSSRYGRDCTLIFKVLLVSGHNNRYKSNEKGFCEQIIIKDPNLFKPVYVLYF